MVSSFFAGVAALLQSFFGAAGVDPAGVEIAPQSFPVCGAATLAALFAANSVRGAGAFYAGPGSGFCGTCCATFGAARGASPAGAGVGAACETNTVL